MQLYDLTPTAVFYSVYRLLVNGKRKDAADNKDIINCPYARARANEKVQGSFGILNSFVSACPIVRGDFVKEMVKRKNRLETRKEELEAILTDAVSQITKEKITLKELAQILTIKSVLGILLDDLVVPSPLPFSPTSPLSRFPSNDELLEAANLIDDLWKSPDLLLTSRLHSFFSSFVLGRLIPAYESQWRVVFYALLEYFRREGEGKGDGDKETLESGKFLKETLRLYAPVKTIKRKVEGEEQAREYPIAEWMRDKEIWGEDALNFHPERVYTAKQEEEIKKVFGSGKLKCVAGIRFVQEFCGAIVKKVAEEYRREGEREWDELPRPLVNARGKYEDMLVVRR